MFPRKPGKADEYTNRNLLERLSVAILEKNWNLGLPALDFQMAIQRVETGSRKSFMAIQVGLPTHSEVHLRLGRHPDGDPAWKSIEDH